ncbi:hypothetical protein JCM17844_16620 [Iodidimonas gelatinilytica]|uniref:TIGR00341 family protein n=1 Tax=Iodidimonas gelatinilytica TaxID=1236966 RepID=A0A5A7MXX8_9PROT|nr:TIGR00341 family protein [Iodidimonas gelatinilytica]GEQ98025.1 hypothetical protein JCM17844_16620 [Iodidimonas gelatinilytica]GEQ99858.1 hypothetical protein JCM17845_04820 [Iodidimonas gelatinilytica]
MSNAFRLIHLRAPKDCIEKLSDLAQSDDVLDWHVGIEQDGESEITMLVGQEKRQHVLDQLQKAMEAKSGWRILVQPLEAAIPMPEEPERPEEERAQARRMQSREEIYNDITSGLSIDTNFLLMVALSSIVAAIGLLKDNVAVVIGAMVIAPLLGSNLALIFAATVGDRSLLAQAAKVAAIGAGLSIAIGVIIGLILPIDLGSRQLIDRTHVGADSIALALASGAAAALSVSTGLASALVGVMVAVALLPPAMAAGIMLGAGQPSLALSAGLLLLVNIVSVNLAGQLVFWISGLKPRTWYERKSASQSLKISILSWIVALAVLSTAIWFRAQI